MKPGFYRKIIYLLNALRRILLIFFILCNSHFSRAEELINDFHSDIIVKVDRSLEVRETIRVSVEGIKIREGIYRDIPVKIITPQGIKIRAKLIISRVLLDGKPEAWEISNHGKFERLKIGRKGVLLEHGSHTFTIVYNVSNQVKFSDDFNTINWNVTGGESGVTIQNASVRILLPAGAKVLQSAAYSGYPGDTSCDCTVGPVGKSTWEGYMTGPLYPSMNYRVSLNFSKGFILPQSPSDVKALIFSRRRIFYAGITGLLFTLLTYFVTWFFIGRNPFKGMIFPKFLPPSGLPADLCRVVYQQGYDKKAFTSAVIQLAVKGALTIRHTETGYMLLKAELQPGNLSFAETRIMNKLFSTGTTLTVTSENFKLFHEAIHFHENNLNRKFASLYFHMNRNWLLPGILVSFIVLAWMNAWIYSFNSDTFIGSLLIGAVYMGFGPVILMLFRRFRASGNAIRVLFLSAIMVALFFLSGSVIQFMSNTGLETYVDENVLLFYTGILLVLLFTGILFTGLIIPGHFQSQPLIRELEGLKLYIKENEQNRNVVKNYPDMTARHFENLIPYAIALDVETAWSLKFEKILNVTSASGYPITTWYSGPGKRFNGAEFGGEIGSAFNAALAISCFPAIEDDDLKISEPVYSAGDKEGITVN